MIDPKLSEYLQRYATPLDSILAENEQFTNDTHPEAHMHSGHVQGKLLEMLSLMIRPEKILEIGTFTGFSALCLAKGLRPGGKLHTIELREQDAEIAQGFFYKAGQEENIILHQGKAAEVIPAIQENWDLVFLDADKVGYIDYYELVLPKLRSGGWMIADNVFFHGEVLQEPVKGKNAKAIQAFNDHVIKDSRVECLMLSVRDGLMIIRKK